MFLQNSTLCLQIQATSNFGGIYILFLTFLWKLQKFLPPGNPVKNMFGHKPESKSERRPFWQNLFIPTFDFSIKLKNERSVYHLSSLPMWFQKKLFWLQCQRLFHFKGQEGVRNSWRVLSIAESLGLFKEIHGKASLIFKNFSVLLKM